MRRGYFSLKPLFRGLVTMALITVPDVWAAEFRGITLGLVSLSWNTQLPPAIAQQAGFFKDEGLDVRIITIAVAVRS